MRVIIRKSTNIDYTNIYNLHKKCFSVPDQWYLSVIRDCSDNGYVIETEKTKIIGVLLYGNIVPCCVNDVFIGMNDFGKEYCSNKNHLKEMNGITMLCIDPKYRNKGLAKKIIEQYHLDNKNKELCLNTRKSNNAYNLYIKMGYNHIGTIKDKYFLPTEDSLFMYKLNN
jgi:ribosomal protein S18 acetylase RimI-like enzyme